MQQLVLPSGDDRSAWERMLSVLKDAVYFLGIKDVVFELNAAQSTVSTALTFVQPKEKEDAKREANKGDRHWRQEWTLRILELLADRYDDTANQYIKAILDAQAVITRRFEVVPSDEAMTDDEIAVLERLSAKAKRQKRRAA